jgi:peptidoglycan-associated lipoprotein
MLNRPTLLAFVLVTVAVAACGGKKPVTDAPAPDPFPGAIPSRPAPATVVTEPPPPPPPIPPEPPIIVSDPLIGAAIEDINRQSPLKAVFFAYDSDALDETARRTLSDNAEILKKYSTWVVTIEGHCDERGTAEYNLALGDRRALSVKNYLVSLGVPADRLKPVSYGSDFPFDPGHDERAWAQNRRAHFMLTAK